MINDYPSPRDRITYTRGSNEGDTLRERTQRLLQQAGGLELTPRQAGWIDVGRLDYLTAFEHYRSR